MIAEQSKCVLNMDLQSVSPPGSEQADFLVSVTVDLFVVLSTEIKDGVWDYNGLPGTETDYESRDA